jgi:hypothetical protein
MNIGAISSVGWAHYHLPNCTSGLNVPPLATGNRTSTSTVDYRAKNLTQAFFGAANQIDQVYRLPSILMAVSQILSDPKVLPRPATAARVPQPMVAKAPAAKMKTAKAEAAKSPATAAAGAIPFEGATVAAAPTAPKAPRIATAANKKSVQRVAAPSADNGAQAAA